MEQCYVQCVWKERLELAKQRTPGEAFRQGQQCRNRGERRLGQSAASSHVVWLEDLLHVESPNRRGWRD